MKVLETERLIMRAFETSDAKVVQRLAGDRAIAQTTLHIPHPYPDGAAESWIESLNKAAEAGRQYGYAMERKDDRELIGAMSIGIHPTFRTGELAYWVGKPYWGQGYGTEAARRLMEYAFDELGLNRVWAAAMSINPASSRIMQKIGMKYEGTLRQHVEKWGVFHDLDYYGILKSEYLSQRASVSSIGEVRGEEM